MATELATLSSKRKKANVSVDVWSSSDVDVSTEVSEALVLDAAASAAVLLAILVITTCSTLPSKPSNATTGKEDIHDFESPPPVIATTTIDSNKIRLVFWTHGRVKKWKTFKSHFFVILCRNLLKSTFQFTFFMHDDLCTIRHHETQCCI